jgi:hypothetical protein
MTSKLFGPANTPIFDPAPTRGQTKVTLPLLGDTSDQGWSWSDTVAPAVDTPGPIWPAIYDLRLESVTLTLVAVSTSAYTVETYVAGGLIATTVLLTGVAQVSAVIDSFVSTDQSVAPTLLANASGDGEGLSIVYRYSRATQ